MISGARRLLEQHNADRLVIGSLLAQVYERHLLAAGTARAVWHNTGMDDSLMALVSEFDQKLHELQALNERAQAKAMEAIQAFGS